MAPINIGLIGFGFHARTVHMPALTQVPELRLAAVATSRSETALQAGEYLRVASYADYRELLTQPDIEAVIVATSSGKHAAICRAALESGKHVFIETPGVSDVAAARELDELACRKNLTVQVGFSLRYCEAFAILKAHLDSLPSPRLFTYEYFPFLSHTFNLALYLSGPVEHVLGATKDSAGSTATIRFANGDTAVIVGRALNNCSVDMETVRVSTPSSFASVEGRVRVRVVENMEPTGVERWSIGASEAKSYQPQPFAGRFLESSGASPQLRAFAAAICSGTPPRSTLPDAIATQLLMNDCKAQAV